MEYWNVGRMEEWNNGIMGKEDMSKFFNSSTY